MGAAERYRTPQPGNWRTGNFDQSRSPTNTTDSITPLSLASLYRQSQPRAMLPTEDTEKRRIRIQAVVNAGAVQVAIRLTRTYL